MKAIRVNANYEAELFLGRQAPAIINQSLEFLAFFLSERPVYTQKKYSTSYLEHVQRLTGKLPQTTTTGPFENWWGALTQPEEERRLNSKLTTARLNLDQGWGPTAQILQSPEDLYKFSWQGQYLLKDPHGMSGQGMKIVDSAEALSSARFPLILEPLLKRSFDFSHYFFSDDKVICYQNLVDQHFQYRGSIFTDRRRPVLEKLPFYSQVPAQQWEEFKSALELVRSLWPSPFSSDSFVFEKDEQLCLRFLSEVNYRRTMGSTAYELGEKFGGERPWTMLLLGKKTASLNFEQMIERLRGLEPRVLLLSPDDVRFQMFLISAENEIEGRELFQELKRLLPDCQFAIDL